MQGIQTQCGIPNRPLTGAVGIFRRHMGVEHDESSASPEPLA